MRPETAAAVRSRRRITASMADACQPAATADITPQCLIRRSVQGLACSFTKLPCTTLAPAETLHLAVRVRRGAATRLCGTLHLAQIILRAIPNAAFDVSVLISYCAASLFGTKHLPVLIRCALPLSAHYISILVFDAVPSGIDLGACEQGQKATDKECIFHDALHLSRIEGEENLDRRLVRGKKRLRAFKRLPRNVDPATE
jgi:hypothetical protein